MSAAFQICFGIKSERYNGSIVERRCELETSDGRKVGEASCELRFERNVAQCSGRISLLDPKWEADFEFDGEHNRFRVATTSKSNESLFYLASLASDIRLVEWGCEPGNSWEINWSDKSGLEAVQLRKRAGEIVCSWGRSTEIVPLEGPHANFKQLFVVLGRILTLGLMRQRNDDQILRVIDQKGAEGISFELLTACIICRMIIWPNDFRSMG
jgi:hypothetical protein